MPKTLERPPVQASLKPPKKDDNYGVCSTCSCTFFEEVQVARVDRDRVVMPGQAVPRLTEALIILRCARCLTLHEPTMVYSNTPSYKLYALMVSELDKPLETVTGVNNSGPKLEEKKV